MTDAWSQSHFSYLAASITEAKNQNQRERKESWFGRMLRNQERSLIVFAALTIFNDGVIIFLSHLTIQYMFYYEYKVQPSDLQALKATMMSPLLLKFFTGTLVDTKIISRKCYNIVFNLLVSALLWGIAQRHFDTPKSITMAIFFVNLFHQFVDATLSSYMLEQARGVEHGNEDLQSFRVMCFAVSMTLGALGGSYFMHIGQPRNNFALMGATYGLAGLQSFFLSSELETNARASIKDNEILKWEELQREKMRNRDDFDAELQPIRPPGFCRLLCFKLRLVKQCFLDPVFSKFIFFMILQGLTMPQFEDFDYYFRLKVMGITPTTINLQQIYFGWTIALIPIFYHCFFIKRNYIYMIMTSQMAYVFADSIGILVGTRYNKELGVSDLVCFLLSGSFAQILEKGFFFFTATLIFAMLIPAGIESTMTSISSTIMVCNLVLFRNISGVLINNHIFHVTKESLDDNYWKLKVVSLIGSLSPFLYMACFIPTRKQTQDVFERNSKAVKKSKEPKAKDIEISDASSESMNQQQHQKVEQIVEVSENSSDTVVGQQIADKQNLKISQEQPPQFLHRSMGDELFTKSPHSHRVVMAKKDHKIIHVDPFVKRRDKSPDTLARQQRPMTASMGTQTPNIENASTQTDQITEQRDPRGGDTRGAETSNSALLRQLENVLNKRLSSRQSSDAYQKVERQSSTRQQHASRSQSSRTTNPTSQRGQETQRSFTMELWFSVMLTFFGLYFLLKSLITMTNHEVVIQQRNQDDLSYSRSTIQAFEQTILGLVLLVPGAYGSYTTFQSSGSSSFASDIVQRFVRRQGGGNGGNGGSNGENQEDYC